MLALSEIPTANHLPREEMNLPSAESLASEHLLLARFANIREQGVYLEPFDGYPQCLFFLSDGTTTWVGRKTLSENHLKNALLEPHCSLVHPRMLLGKLTSFQICQEGILLFFDGSSAEARENFFTSILREPATAELSYPFCYFKPGTREERKSPPQGWTFTPERMKNLGSGETILREFTRTWLAKFDLKNRVLYDPACSTGQFLYEIQSAYPEATVIGQDLSLQMVEEARRKLRIVHHGDAVTPLIADGSADFVFSRFLNSEVVTTLQAYRILESLKRVLSPQGKFILLGHTPILLNSASFTYLGFEVEQQLGVHDGNVFQYYVLSNKLKENQIFGRTR